MATPFINVTEAEIAATARGTAIITAACDFVRLATEQDISPTVTGGTAILDGTGTDWLLLPQLPVTAAGTVIENTGTLVVGTDYKLSDNGELYRLPGVIDTGWSTQELRTYWWPGRQNIVVTYDYGYSTVPQDLKEVAIQMAKRLSSQNANGNVVFEQLGQRSVRYAGAASEWSNTEKLVLSRYRQAR